MFEVSVDLSIYFSRMLILGFYAWKSLGRENGTDFMGGDGKVEVVKK